MLTIEIPPQSLFDESTAQVWDIENYITLKMEHSLFSVSLWESKYKVPYIDENRKRTKEESLFYIKCMVASVQNQYGQDIDIPDYAFYALTNDDIRKIEQYIMDNRTASWVNDPSDKDQRNSEKITSELIYYWMTIYQIPSEYQYWHLSRLLMLIRICNVKNSPSKKMSTRETLDMYRRLNAQRRKK